MITSAKDGAAPMDKEFGLVMIGSGDPMYWVEWYVTEKARDEHATRLANDEYYMSRVRMIVKVKAEDYIQGKLGR
jgi:hypothetical protein